MGHTSRRYFSLYLGKSVAKDDSSRRLPPGRESPLDASQDRISQWLMFGSSS